MAIKQRCTVCSTNFLKSFEAVFGARIRSSVPRTSCMPLALLAHNVYCSRGQLDFALGSKSLSTMLSEGSKADEIPWYLRVATPKVGRFLPAEMPTLPRLPRNAPVELADMLNQLSEVHGITNLNIIDLRPLDPPPAIGTNVLMLVGSARSVRHLHATADKVCRYMRAQYKWLANADGLLGRNQVKLINRRKQRTGKVVSIQMGEIEEVGSSDWVCVHGGDHRLVVQLLTCTKREDIAIDGLWRGILERDERHRIADAERKAERKRKWEEADCSFNNLVRSTQKKEMVNVVLVNREVTTAEVNYIELANEHTKDMIREAERVEITAQTHKEIKNALITEKEVMSRAQTNVEAINILQENDATEAAQEVRAVRKHYNTLTVASAPIVWTRHSHQLGVSAPDFAGSVNVTNHHTFPEFIRTGDLTDYLSTLTTTAKDSSYTLLQTHIDALKSPLVCPESLIGTGFNDKSSTPFLRTFYQALASAAPSMQIKFELKLTILRITHKSKFYPVDSLLEFLQGLRQQGMTLKAEHYYVLMFHLASCTDRRPSIGSDWLLAADAQKAVLESYIQDFKSHMSPEEATDVEDRPEFRYAIFLALLREPVSGVRQALLSHNSQVGMPLDVGLSRNAKNFALHPEIMGGNGYSSLSPKSAYHYTIEQHHLDYLTALGLGHKWELLWKWWKKLPLHGVMRGLEYYKLVFELVALAGNQREAIYCLRWLGAETMARELPSVKLRNPYLANAFLRVVDIADPDAKNTEWTDVRKFCLRVEKS